MGRAIALVIFSFQNCTEEVSAEDIVIVADD